MPAQISQGAINVNGASAPDAYVQVLPPPSFIRGVATNVAGIVGSASWGPLNTPILLGSPSDGVVAYGPTTAVPATEVNDLPTDIGLVFLQGQGAPLGIWAVRASDGSDLKSTVAIPDTTAATVGPLDGVDLTALYSGTLGNSITFTVSTGSKGVGFFNVVISGLQTYGIAAESYLNVPGTAGASSTFWPNIINYINNGQSTLRGPSRMCAAAAGVVTALGPAVGTYTFGTTTALGSGKTAFVQQAGTNGTATNATLVTNAVGTAVASPPTGILSLRGLNPSCAVAYVAGNTTQANYATIQTFGDAEGCVVLGSFPTGTSTSTTLTNRAGVAGYTIDDPMFVYVKDYLQFLDQTNKIVRSVPNYSALAGTICRLQPWQSPLNKQVYGFLGSERANPITGNIPYSPIDIGSLNQAGVTLLAQPIPAGNSLGVRTAVTSSSDPVRAPIEYTTMTNYLAKSFAAFIGKYVGLNQSTRPNDPLRQQVLSDFNGFLGTLSGNLAIDSFNVICDLTNNTPTTIAQHFMYASAVVRYMASVWYFIVSLIGGTTAVTVSQV